MRSRVKMKLSDKTQDGWYPWFAWRPVRIFYRILDSTNSGDRSWQTVWLEWLERRQYTHNDLIGKNSVWVYREIQGENR